MSEPARFVTACCESGVLPIGGACSVHGGDACLFELHREVQRSIQKLYRVCRKLAIQKGLLLVTMERHGTNGEAWTEAWDLFAEPAGVVEVMPAPTPEECEAVLGIVAES